jgi:hypothetical protein
VSEIHYAIEIDTEATDVTDSNIACDAGVIRVVTDRPGYDGARIGLSV